MLTNDLLYESNDSRDMRKGSMSPDSLVRVLNEVPEGCRLGQVLLVPVGEILWLSAGNSKRESISTHW